MALEKLPKLNHTTILTYAEQGNIPADGGALEKAILAGARADTSRQDKPVDDGTPSPQKVAVEAPQPVATAPAGVEAKQRGRYYIFKPTNDRVTLVRVNIGLTYDGKQL